MKTQTTASFSISSDSPSSDQKYSCSCFVLLSKFQICISEEVSNKHLFFGNSYEKWISIFCGLMLDFCITFFYCWIAHSELFRKNKFRYVGFRSPWIWLTVCCKVSSCEENRQKRKQKHWCIKLYGLMKSLDDQERRMQWNTYRNFFFFKPARKIISSEPCTNFLSL